jgi:Icc-related predicted phosphoesterase
LPEVVLLGGDLLPGLNTEAHGLFDDFIGDYLHARFRELKDQLDNVYPFVGLIMGNDDPRVFEKDFERGEATGVWYYLHDKCIAFHEYNLTGYSFIPPTPFRLKDWEKYDVSRFVDPGCAAPMEGIRSVNPDYDMEFSTIERDLVRLAEGISLDKTIMLFHSPPYHTKLDRAGIDGMKVDHVPIDVHVGSIAIQRFIEARQPRVTLHGHIHESVRITGEWKEQMGNTWMFGAAHDGPELSLISFDPDKPEKAERLLL